MVGICHDSSFVNFLKCTVRTTVCNIPFNCIRKKKDILHCHADVVTQIVKVPVLDVYAIYQNLAGGRVDKTAQQVHDGGFAGTGGTENADCLSFFHRKADILYDILIICRIGNIFKFNISFHMFAGNRHRRHFYKRLFHIGCINFFYGGDKTVGIIDPPACHTQRSV